MKKILVLVLTIIATTSVFAEDNMKIAVFDAQEVLDNIQEGKAAASRMEKLQNQKKQEFDEKKKELEKMKKELDSQALVLSKDALAEKERAFQKKYVEFQQEAVAAERELQQKELSETGEIFKKINAVIQKLGQEGNYDFILEKNQGAVTYFKSGDITDKVVEQYNKTYSSKKK